MAKLALVRHGQSEYNKLGLWTGWDDPSLTEEGIRQARIDGKILKGIDFDYAYTSVLTRTQETLGEIEGVLKDPKIFFVQAEELNERDYGDFTGKNKWEIKKEIGEEAFLNLRRGWDFPIPNGESLKDVYDREIPYFQKEIEPKLKANKNILIASSGNSLRAIIKYLEDIPDKDIAQLEIAFGEIYLYQIDENGRIISKVTRRP